MKTPRGVFKRGGGGLNCRERALLLCNEGSAWAELREAQTLTLQVPETGMAVTTDIGNPKDIHPTNKLDVGKPLAAIALSNLYDKKMICNGPSFKSMKVKGNQIFLSFNDVGTGLTCTDKYRYLKGFEVAGRDHIFHYAKAFIKDNLIVVYSDKIEKPEAVHFGWAGDASDNNLFNAEGFPALPFRTDDWKTVTQKVLLHYVQTQQSSGFQIAANLGESKLVKGKKLNYS